MRVQRLDHYSIRTTGLDQTIRFYTGVIELDFPATEVPGAKAA